MCTLAWDPITIANDIAEALYWAEDDIRTNDAARWNWCHLPREGMWQCTRGALWRCEPNGEHVYSVSVLVPRKDLVLVGFALAAVAGQVEYYKKICWDQCALASYSGYDDTRGPVICTYYDCARINGDLCRVTIVRILSTDRVYVDWDTD